MKFWTQLFWKLWVLLNMREYIYKCKFTDMVFDKICNLNQKLYQYSLTLIIFKLFCKSKSRIILIYEIRAKNLKSVIL